MAPRPALLNHHFPQYGTFNMAHDGSKQLPHFDYLQLHIVADCGIDLPHLIRSMKQQIDPFSPR